MIFQCNSMVELLQNELQRRIEINPLYSANAFARGLGISKGYLSLILSGKRPVTRPVLDNILKGSHWTKNEQKFAELLYIRDCSTDEQSSDYFQRRIEEIRTESGVNQLSMEIFEIVSDWRHSALLEALNMTDLVDSDYTELAKKIGLPPEEVKSLAKQLERAGLAEIEEERVKRKDQALIATPSEIRAQALVRLHHQLINKALLALHNQDIEIRNITGMTMAIDPQKLPEAKKRIKAFVRELTAFLEGGERTKLYQLNTQLFELKEDFDA